MEDLNIKHYLNTVILGTKEPLIIRDFLKWKIFNWDLHKWNDLLKDEKLEFRCGLNAKTESPQWERTTQIIPGKFQELLELSDHQKWFYFDYKYLNQWLLNAGELRENIQFEDLGLNDVNPDDSTIWIGTKGAHTPCHIDTYGCNVVVQVYGMKRWLLFPPDENLKPTRVPYEESSIYSRLNFFSPTDLSDFKDINYCKIVMLRPGDVLIVPHKWWHYVENLELSISINSWLPLPEDDNERQKECLIQMLMGALVKDLKKANQENILNPNSDDVLSSSLESGLGLLNSLKNISSSNSTVENETVHLVIDNLLEKHKFIERIKDTSEEDFKSFLHNQSNRFSGDRIRKEKKQNISIENLIHALTHPDVIQLAMNKLLE